MKINFLLLLCFSFSLCDYDDCNIYNYQSYFLKSINLNRNTKIERSINDNSFKFYISKRISERTRLYIEISYQTSSNNCNEEFSLESFLKEQDENDCKYYPLYYDSSSFGGGNCFYKFSLLLDDDISHIGFQTVSLPPDVNIIHAKVYEKRSYLWIILLCVGLGIIALGVGIGLFIYFYKKRKNKSVINEPLSPEVEPVFKPSLENSQN